MFDSYYYRNLYRLCRSFIKRKAYQLVYGFDYADTWSLDISLAKWILPRLRYFKANLHSHPADLSFEEWQGILDDIIYAFNYVVDEDKYLSECWPKDKDFSFTIVNHSIVWNDTRPADYSKLDPCLERYAKGMRYFCIYFRHLWD
jgi:hypothetical protein